MEHVPLEDDEEPIFDVPSEHIIQSSKGKNWHGIDVAEIIHPLDDFALPAIPRHILVVNLSTPSELQEKLVGRRGHLGPGGLVILPAGAASTWHLEHQGEVRHLHLYLSPMLIQQIAAEVNIHPDTVQLIDAMGVTDPQITSIALSLLSELRSDGLGGKLYVESLANLLVIHLLRHHSSMKLPSIPHHVGLPRTTLRQATGYIEDHLAEDLSLSVIAAAVNISPYHFARLFKASVGLSPHQYVIHRRIERAKLLLATTNWPLTTIAHMVGCSSDSHLTMHFKRLTGLTPKQYR